MAQVYFSEVTQHIKFNIVQIGGKDDVLLPNCLDLRGKTSWNQTASIIRNASLFLGGDSVCSHMAAAKAVPSIVLWGGTLSSTCSTSWNQDKVTHMNPVDRFGCATACHSATCIRYTKCINSITPESVLARVGEILGQDTIKPFKLLHSGPLASTPVIEFVPVTINQDTFNLFSRLQGLVSIRGEMHLPHLGELSNFCNQLNLKYIVVLPPCDFSQFNIHINKVEQLLVYVDEANIEAGIRMVKELTKKMYKVSLISKLDHTAFNKYKMDIVDYPPISKLTDYAATPEQTAKLLDGEVSVTSARKIVGKDAKLYLTFEDAKNNKNSIEITSNCAIYKLGEEHLKELQFLTIRKY